MPAPYRTVIVGLGQVGSRFDEDAGRKVPWSHAGAYLALPSAFTLVGACDISPENTSAFRQRCPSVPVTPDLPALIREARPEVVSICTPAPWHGSALDAALASPDLKAIWCEKPLSHQLADAERIVAATAERGIHLLVSFNRRWQPLWQRTRDVVTSGQLGTIRSVRVAMPNRLHSIGSHAVDLAMMLGGSVSDAATLHLPALDQDGEKAVAALLKFDSGAGGIIQVTGMKSRLIVEAEVTGDAGRIFVSENRGLLKTQMFVAGQYAGYHELGDETVETWSTPVAFSAFTAMATELAELIAGSRRSPTSSGANALNVQRLLHRMETSS